MINFDDVLERFKKHSGVKNDKDLAALLGISAPDFSNRKKRGTLLPLILEWGINEGVNLQFLIYGSHNFRDEGGLELDTTTLRAVIEAVEEYLQSEKRTCLPRP